MVECETQKSTLLQTSRTYTYFPGAPTRKIFYWDNWLIFSLLKIITVQDTAYKSINNCFELVCIFHFPHRSFFAIAPFEREKRNIIGLEISS